MASIFDYLEWRGDIPITRDNLNEIDNLIFSQLSYIDYRGIDFENGEITLEKAESLFLKSHTKNEKMGLFLPKNITKLFHSIANATRFREIKISDFVYYIDNELEKQFAAITFHLPDDTMFITFRGTDDAIVGLKEDFKLCFLDELPAQKDAVVYTNDVLKKYSAPFFMGGHSKGANLAMYAAMFLENADIERLIRVYCNDGPGFGKSVFGSERYLKVKSKIIRLIPQSSIVGVLLENDSSYELVKSNQLGLLQHDVFSWSVFGSKITRAEKLSDNSMVFDSTIKSTLQEMTNEEREKFIDALFGVMLSTKATTFTELVKTKKAAFAKQMLKVDSKTRKVLFKTFRIIFGSAWDSYFEVHFFAKKKLLKENKEKLKNEKKLLQEKKNSANEDEADE